MGSSRVAPEPSFDSIGTMDPEKQPQRRRARGTNVLRRLEKLEEDMLAMDGTPPHSAGASEGYKTTALHQAALRGDVRRMVMLLGQEQAERHLALRDEAGWLPLHYAACAGRRYSFRLPLGPHAPPGVRETCQRVLQSVRATLQQIIARQQEEEELLAALAASEAAPEEKPAVATAKDSFGERLDAFFLEHDAIASHNLLPRHREAPRAPGSPPSKESTASPPPPPPQEKAEAAPAEGAAKSVSPQRPRGHRAAPRAPSNAAKEGEQAAHRTAPQKAQATMLADGLEEDAERAMEKEQPRGVWVEVQHSQSGQRVIEIILAELHDVEVADAELLQRQSSGEGYLLPNCPLQRAALVMNELLQVRVASTQKGHEAVHVGEHDDGGLLDGPLGECVMKPQLRLKQMKALIPALKNTIGAEYVMMVSRVAQPEKVLCTERVRGQGKAAWEATLALDLELPVAWPLEVELRLRAADPDGTELHESVAVVSLPTWKGTHTVNMRSDANKPADEASSAGKDALGSSARIEYEVSMPYPSTDPAGGSSLVAGSFAAMSLLDGATCLSILLRAGADPNVRDLVSATPLHKAVAHGDMRALRVLLQAGGDLEAFNMYGDRCLHRAVENARVATSRLLLKCSADPNVPNNRGDVPLHIACAGGEIRLVNMLLAQGAIALSANQLGWTPLHTSVAYEQYDSLAALVTFHKRRRLPWCDLQSKGMNDTPLHVAVRMLRLQELLWMVKNGFENALVVKNADGRTVAQLLAVAIKELRLMAKRAKRASSGRASPPKAKAGGTTAGSSSPGGRSPWARGSNSPERARKKRSKAPAKSPAVTLPFEECLHRLGTGGIEQLESALVALTKMEGEIERALAKEREQLARKKKEALAKKNAAASKGKSSSGRSAVKLRL
ncbi:hypothetical protein AB1Y20_008173 [Prymnesium parvum]|uniref:Uncharacterized protein n=1 Tax=Prymnesium parvum TaxID=97485 RepID=A0AB34IVZ3_PRYPA